MTDENKKKPHAGEGTKTGLSRPAFTVDQDDSLNLANVPSITKLLNRKTLEAKPVAAALLKISPMKEEGTLSAMSPASKPEIRAQSISRDRRSNHRLVLWEMGRMKQSIHPQEKLVHDL